ncbi:MULTISPECIES: 16S rRNA (adenine(1518)-N(6)/adenine(1519)-N(6))-dimethyltransferase RsmA [unclassified Breznakia]|uniref:16S rRNA (adenine(1518)-N(6)/adenine(1519)-N(6))- dimethyltransferase RsmA n=1 Tax=unclassified Breznakia TaxID=2623764 RepID=UPI002472F208|nr:MULTISPECIES: 16S rRNA (adenine(1518)-N(6)/adenine(1519)-N(6))-dimethyltransferase RsmA [unclassified Breznakia]MDH6366887.1 16S rRNA (adenine1518-N6/adenine1519-N6)-dimethyltransferase [Breznakia sp. PH1-1]MDH6404065.1 16S rRNA (adenine1518-N6/adenine1519-N6)-dimethyltransferase [Breznakia sp. PF1-11]MDH6411713.1 16S rRNA (adenine1518-N6/adenine1519-N6)-dimethyltransferase [Breznakia sp. PFB1-11]MDH6414053.1 16S rRNA (adenine1518-N6/adenine1519-N6)-dimethyltransferase [Breznakia sp. PFB1-14
MDRIIATPSYTKEILEKHQMYAKKNYGQNFLVEPQIVEKIAVESLLSENSTALEIGPGIGALTQFLAIHAKKVIAFEIDDRLLPVLDDTLAPYNNVEIIHQDFLQADLAKILADESEVVVAANLPYYITTPILFKLFESDVKIKKITVMMQKEVADRFSAKVNTKDYNALSIVSQYNYDVQTILKISKHVFNPKPNVDSAVVQFTYRPSKLVDNEEAFFELVKACFKQRRKTILNNLGEYLQDKEKAKVALEAANLDSKRRAESMEATEFARLYEVLHDH